MRMQVHPRVTDLLIAALLLGVTIAAFGEIPSHQFITYDGDAYVVANEYVQAGLTRETVAWAFTTAYTGNWHPLTWLSHMLDCQLYGLDPAGHHLTNLLLHAASTLLLFVFLRRATGYPWRSAMVAALFAVHPLHVESVAWIAERKDVLSTMFWMLTMLAYLRYAERPGVLRYLLVALALALGLLSKAMLVTLPLVLLLLDYWPLNRVTGLDRASGPGAGRAWMRVVTMNWRLVVEKLPLLALSAVASWITFLVQRADGSMSTLDALPTGTRVANALVSYAGYLAKMVWPADLAPFYPYDPTLPVVRLVASLVLLVGVTVWVAMRARRSLYLVVGWLWYLGTLVPVIGLVQVGYQAMADRYTYVPLIGPFIMLVWAVAEWASAKRVSRLLLPATAIVLAGVLLVATRAQVHLWRDNLTLFQHALAVTTRNHVAHYMVAGELAKLGQRREAMAHYAAAVEFRPNWANARNNYAVLLEEHGMVDDAIEQYREAIRVDPRYAKAHDNLGALLAAKQRYAEAAAHFEAALRIDPSLASAHRHLGLLLLRAGRPEQARDHLLRATQMETTRSRVPGDPDRRDETTRDRSE